MTLRAVPFPLGCTARPNVSVNLITVSSEISVCKMILAWFEFAAAFFFYLIIFAYVILLFTQIICWGGGEKGEKHH